MQRSPNRRPERNARKPKKDQKTKPEEKLKFKFEPKRNISFVGKTDNQKLFISSLYTNDLILARGPGGTGKTYLSVAFACKEMSLGKFKKIIITRSSIPTGKSLGFFPGTVEDKLKPWLAQPLAYIEEFVQHNVAELWLKNGQIQMVPMETMRGRSFSDSCVIVDEAQNLSLEELKCITTRIGENSKLILCGDGSQSDLKSNAYDTFAQLLMKHKVVKTDVITFTYHDCLRSGLCFELLQMFDKENL